MDKSFKLRESVINIENTTRFKSAEEVDNYMKILGAKNRSDCFVKGEWPFPTDHVYEYRNLLYAYYEENHSIIALGDLVDVALFGHYQMFEITAPLYYKYFYHNQILNLEGLIYYTLCIEGNDVGLEDNEMTRYYRKKVHDCKMKALKIELNKKSSIIEKYNWNEKHLVNDYNEELKNNLNNLSKLAYLLNIPNISEQFNELINDIVFHSKSDNNNIYFNWKTTDLKISCDFTCTKDLQKIVINLCYDDDRSETLSYVINNKKETIYYRPIDELGNEETFDITNELIIDKNNKTRKASNYDYDKFNKAVESFYKVIIEKLPYLNNYLDKKTKIKK